MSTRRHTPLRTDEVHPHSCGRNLRLRILGRVPFFASLSPTDLSRINERFHETGFEPSAAIYFSGDPAARLYVVAAGKVKLSRHTLSGQDVVLDLLGPGDFFGSLAILGDEGYPDTAQAQTQVCALGVDAQAFQSILLDHPGVALAVLQETARRLRAAQETIRQLSAFPVERRIAALLLKLAEKHGEPAAAGILLQVPLSRQDLADMTGTTVETASRIISQWQKAGLVHTGRQWIALSDLPSLTAISREI